MIFVLFLHKKNTSRHSEQNLIGSSGMGVKLRRIHSSINQLGPNYIQFDDSKLSWASSESAFLHTGYALGSAGVERKPMSAY